MTAPSPVLDLDDAARIEAADSTGVLRSAALGGAQVRATAAAIAEGALARLADLCPRSVLLVAGPGRAARAAALLTAAVGGTAGLPVVALSETPPWVGPLDVVVVAGEDAADPRLVTSVDRALRRGAEVVIVAPDEGPLRAVGAGRAATLPPRVRVPDHNTLLRYLAAGIAVLAAVDSVRSGPLLPDLERLADALDAEAARDRPGSEVFGNPAKALAARMFRQSVVLTGDAPATAEVARHGAEVALRCGGAVVAAADLTDVIAAASKLAGPVQPDFDPFFHDEELDGPAPTQAVRVFVLSTDSDRIGVERRLAILPDAQLVGADAVGAIDLPAPTEGSGSVLEPLAILCLRLEMAAAYGALLAGGIESSYGDSPFGQSPIGQSSFGEGGGH